MADLLALDFQSLQLTRGDEESEQTIQHFMYDAAVKTRLASSSPVMDLLFGLWSCMLWCAGLWCFWGQFYFCVFVR